MEYLTAKREDTEQKRAFADMCAWCGIWQDEQLHDRLLYGSAFYGTGFAK